jgi:cysteine desulfurase
VTEPVYLDYNATTPVDRRVLEAMLPYFTKSFGNAASVDHAFGNEAQQAVERAREQVASLIGATPEEITFTSGATEANNIAITGTLARSSDDAELIVSAIEHPAVLEPARRIGERLRLAPVSSDGILDPLEIERRLTDKTALVSVMAANNETGAIQPIREIGRICAEAEVPFHCDAVQGAGRIALDVEDAKVALLSLSAHKIYGPKGVGALYVRRRGRRAKVAPLHYGGGQERNLRPGTVNVPGIVGFGVAAELARRERRRETARLARLKQQLVASLAEIGGVELNTPAESSLPQTVSARIAGVGARALMHATRDELAFSSGSACSTTAVEPSHVLLAQGIPSQAINEAVRLSFGRLTTEAEIAHAGAILVSVVGHLRLIGRRAA